MLGRADGGLKELGLPVIIQLRLKSLDVAYGRLLFQAQGNKVLMFTAAPCSKRTIAGIAFGFLLSDLSLCPLWTAGCCRVQIGPLTDVLSDLRLGY